MRVSASCRAVLPGNLFSPVSEVSHSRADLNQLLTFVGPKTGRFTESIYMFVKIETL